MSEGVLSVHVGPWTVDDLDELPDDGVRREIIEGALLVFPSPASRHQLAVGRLIVLLDGSAPPGLVPLPGIGVAMGTSYLEPDVAVVRESVIGVPGNLAPPDVLLAVEVVSPSSTAVDRVLKPGLYAGAGIPSYWRVELTGADAPVVVVHDLVGDVYVETTTVRAGGSHDVARPFPLTLEPARLTGPRRPVQLPARTPGDHPKQSGT